MEMTRQLDIKPPNTNNSAVTILRGQISVRPEVTLQQQPQQHAVHHKPSPPQVLVPPGGSNNGGTSAGSTHSGPTPTPSQYIVLDDLVRRAVQKEWLELDYGAQWWSNDHAPTIYANSKLIPTLSAFLSNRWSELKPILQKRPVAVKRIKLKEGNTCNEGRYRVGNFQLLQSGSGQSFEQYVNEQYNSTTLSNSGSHHRHSGGASTSRNVLYGQQEQHHQQYSAVDVKPMINQLGHVVNTSSSPVISSTLPACTSLTRVHQQQQLQQQQHQQQQQQHHQQQQQQPPPSSLVNKEPASAATTPHFITLAQLLADPVKDNIFNPINIKQEHNQQQQQTAAAPTSYHHYQSSIQNYSSSSSSMINYATAKTPPLPVCTPVKTPPPPLPDCTTVRTLSLPDSVLAAAKTPPLPSYVGNIGISNQQQQNTADSVNAAIINSDSSLKMTIKLNKNKPSSKSKKIKVDGSINSGANSEGQKSNTTTASSSSSEQKFNKKVKLSSSSTTQQKRKKIVKYRKLFGAKLKECEVRLEPLDENILKKYTGLTFREVKYLPPSSSKSSGSTKSSSSKLSTTGQPKKNVSKRTVPFKSLPVLPVTTSVSLSTSSSSDKVNLTSTSLPSTNSVTTLNDVTISAIGNGRKCPSSVTAQQSTAHLLSSATITATTSYPNLANSSSSAVSNLPTNESNSHPQPAAASISSASSSSSSSSSNVYEKFKSLLAENTSLTITSANFDKSVTFTCTDSGGIESIYSETPSPVVKKNILETAAEEKSTKEDSGDKVGEKKEINESRNSGEVVSNDGESLSKLPPTDTSGDGESLSKLPSTDTSGDGNQEGGCDFNVSADNDKQIMKKIKLEVEDEPAESKNQLKIIKVEKAEEEEEKEKVALSSSQHDPPPPTTDDKSSAGGTSSPSLPAQSSPPPQQISEDSCNSSLIATIPPAPPAAAAAAESGERNTVKEEGGGKEEEGNTEEKNSKNLSSTKEDDNKNSSNKRRRSRSSSESSSSGGGEQRERTPTPPAPLPPDKSSSKNSPSLRDFLKKARQMSPPNSSNNKNSSASDNTNKPNSDYISGKIIPLGQKRRLSLSCCGGGANNNNKEKLRRASSFNHEGSNGSPSDLPVISSCISLNPSVKPLGGDDVEEVTGNNRNDANNSNNTCAATAMDMNMNYTTRTTTPVVNKLIQKPLTNTNVSSKNNKQNKDGGITAASGGSVVLPLASTTPADRSDSNKENTFDNTTVKTEQQQQQQPPPSTTTIGSEIITKRMIRLDDEPPLKKLHIDTSPNKDDSVLSENNTTNGNICKSLKLDLTKMKENTFDDTTVKSEPQQPPVTTTAGSEIITKRMIRLDDESPLKKLHIDTSPNKDDSVISKNNNANGNIYTSLKLDLTKMKLEEEKIVLTNGNNGGTTDGKYGGVGGEVDRTVSSRMSRSSEKVIVVKPIELALTSFKEFMCLRCDGIFSQLRDWKSHFEGGQPKCANLK